MIEGNYRLLGLNIITFLELKFVYGCYQSKGPIITTGSSSVNLTRESGEAWVDLKITKGERGLLFSY